MAALRLVRFVPAHLDALRPDAPDAAVLASLDRAAFCAREAGRAATALAGDGRVLGIGGLALGADGVHAWILGSGELRARHALSLHRWARAALVALATAGHRTVHATVAHDFAAGHRWAARLGFVPCGGEDGFSTYRLTLAGHSSIDLRSCGKFIGRAKRTRRGRLPGRVTSPSVVARHRERFRSSLHAVTSSHRSPFFRVT